MRAVRPLKLTPAPLRLNPTPGFGTGTLWMLRPWLTLRVVMTVYETESPARAIDEKSEGPGVDPACGDEGRDVG